MKNQFLVVIIWICVCLGILSGISSVSIFDREKLNKRIQARKEYKLEQLEQIRTEFLETDSLLENNQKANTLGVLPVITEEETEEEVISTDLFNSAFIPFCEKEKILIPIDLWNEIKRTSASQEEALYLAGLTLKESTWDRSVIGDKHAKGSYGFTQVNKKYHYKTATSVHPNFFTDKKIWQDPYYNLAAFRLAFEDTSGRKNDWYSKIVCYNVGPDMIGNPGDPNRGIRYANKIETYVNQFKEQLADFTQSS